MPYTLELIEQARLRLPERAQYFGIDGGPRFSILGASGQSVGHVHRANLRIKGSCEIEVEDDAIDVRIAAARGVTADPLMNP
jgi:hypothetical protein